MTPAVRKWIGRESICVAVILFGLVGIALVLSQVPALPAERCLASWYGAEMRGRTASGERFDPMGMTAAHRTAPFGSIIGVRLYATHLAQQREIRVRINDRGPARSTGRCIDLAEGAAIALGIRARGTALVEIERIGR